MDSGTHGGLRFFPVIVGSRLCHMILSRGPFLSRKLRAIPIKNGIPVSAPKASQHLRYLNLDDCWAKSRKDDGTLVADQAPFPMS